MNAGQLYRWLRDSLADGERPGLPEDTEIVVVVSGNPIEYEPTLWWDESGKKVQLFITRHRGGPKPRERESESGNERADERGT